ncbi:MAG TPA: hypothetical protein VMZ29_10950 [Candidatus Bathyarchaeia archaeon]|nr:hypothetical protein [Candidatus Bathyarchaeia archaeon]
MKISGSTKIQGNLFSRKDVDLSGFVIVDGNIKAENVFIGMPVEMHPIKDP